MHGIGRRNVYDFGFQGVGVLADFHRRMPHVRIPGRQPWQWMLNDRLFRQAKSFSCIGQVVPPNGEDLFAPGESKEDQFSVAPGGFLRYIAGSSDDAAGFRWSLIDGDTNQILSEGQLRSGNATGEPVAPLSSPGPHYVGTMQPWPNGANLIVRITNLNLTAASSTRIQLALFFASPVGRTGG